MDTRTTLHDEFGDTIVHDENGDIVVFHVKQKMDWVEAKLLRSIPKPRRMCDLNEYMNMRRLTVLHVLTFMPFSEPSNMDAHVKPPIRRKGRVKALLNP